MPITQRLDFCATMSCCEHKTCDKEAKILAVIFDLDGTLLDTGRSTRGVLQGFFAKYGKELDTEKEKKKRLGMTQKESAAILVKDYDLPLTPEEFVKEITPFYREKFEEAAKKMGVDAANCLVIEDSLIGVEAAKAAKMKVAAVPSRREADCHALANVVLHSLLEFRPELWGLPAFDDWVDNVLPVEPIQVSGSYVGGFLNEVKGDGTFSLPDQVVGVYFGWATVDRDRNFKAIVSINWDHSLCAANRKIYVCLIDEDGDPISNQQMQIFLVGYMRECNNKELTAVDSGALQEYKSIASVSLDLPEFAHHFCVF
ncbi:hypothetical protein L6164_018613 [Bauhinia variegata]|uniref:Uncharacterized protein n=1 Tax=Bauhinia variegata TaxID=167791 RepID=A0ACB9NCE3_BAUVA|nr:hypothetical protein L6164_018613 [Bauhinia variegata]